MPLRVSERDEALGLDVTQDDEEAHAHGEGMVPISPEAGLAFERPVGSPDAGGTKPAVETRLQESRLAAAGPGPCTQVWRTSGLGSDGREKGVWMLRSRAWQAGVAAVAAAAVAVLGGSAARASSVGIVRCSGPGGGAAGLIAAVNTANASGGGIIVLAPGCTYSLTSANNTTAGANGLPVITSPITIIGNGATIAGNNSNFRIIMISGAAGGSLRLIGTTVTGGNAAGEQPPANFGGGIFNVAGTLTLDQSVVTRNSASGAGGGIASGTMGQGPGATATLNNSEVSWNTVPSDGMGAGGILSISGTLTLNNSVVDNNSASGGGGIASGNGMGGGSGSFMTLNNSVIRDNAATGGADSGGGGVSNGGTLESNNTQFIDNSAPGGTGGGFLNHATATLNNAYVSGNSAGVGAGVANLNLQGVGAPPLPVLVMNNGTVTGNTASVAGGGIANVAVMTPTLGTVALRNTQVTGNSPNNCIPVGTIGGCNDSVFVFTATLDGASQNPPLAVPGTGAATVTWDTATNQMTVTATFGGLTSSTTAAHIHCCVSPPGNTGVATAVPTFPGFPLGVTSGSYAHAFDMTDPASYNPAFVTANGGTTASAAAALLAGLRAGQAYLNIHTTTFPGGEIRGFLQEP
ncbi:MAG TPA: CHRD domain-containing protein [Gaiellaceae bacterium]|nr:CHRD domain-containing protein [Gaiellaceae bacterium]